MNTVPRVMSGSNARDSKSRMRGSEATGIAFLADNQHSEVLPAALCGRDAHPLDVAVVARTGRVGGAENFIVRLYESLGPAVSSKLLGELDGWDRTALPRVDVRLSDKWENATFLPGLLRLPAERNRVRRAAESIDVDVFHMHFKREQIGLTGALSQQAPVVWTEHGRLSTGLYGKVIARLYRQAASDVAAIACVSRHVADQIAPLVAGRTTVSVIENAVDTKRFVPADEANRLAAREHFSVAHDGLVFTFVGRLDPGKRPALAHSAASAAGAKFLMAGSGTLEMDVRREARGTETRLLGNIQSPVQLYQAADVHIFTSDGSGEGFPTVLLESAACGVPTVAVRGCGFEQEVCDSGGLIAEPNADSIAAASSDSP